MWTLTYVIRTYLTSTWCPRWKKYSLQVDRYTWSWFSAELIFPKIPQKFRRKWRNFADRTDTSVEINQVIKFWKYLFPLKFDLPKIPQIFIFDNWVFVWNFLNGWVTAFGHSLACKTKRFNSQSWSVTDIDVYSYTSMVTEYLHGTVVLVLCLHRWENIPS